MFSQVQFLYVVKQQKLKKKRSWKNKHNETILLKVLGVPMMWKF